MENVSLKSIKNKSIKKIFEAVASSTRISRAEIAEATGLSLMTVGKVIDALIELKIVKQEMEKTGGIGRRAGLLSLDTVHYAVVIDLSERTFTLSVIDLSLRLVDTMTYTYDRSLYYDDNLYLFLKKAEKYIKHLDNKENMIGIGITVPGIYISSEDRIESGKIPELNSISLRKTVEDILGEKIAVIMKNVKAAAVSGVAMIPEKEDRVIIYMFMGESVDGAVYSKGSFSVGAHEFECDFGRMILRYGETLEERIKSSRSDEDMANELSSAVYNIVAVLDPDVFIIESELPREPEFLANQIKRQLREQYGLPKSRTPEFLAGGSHFRHSARGLVMLMRDKWIDTII